MTYTLLTTRLALLVEPKHVVSHCARWRLLPVGSMGHCCMLCLPYCARAMCTLMSAGQDSVSTVRSHAYAMQYGRHASGWSSEMNGKLIISPVLGSEIIHFQKLNTSITDTVPPITMLNVNGFKCVVIIYYSCSAIAELGNIGSGLVCPSIFAHSSMMTEWIFFIFDTMNRYHGMLMHVMQNLALCKFE